MQLGGERRGVRWGMVGGAGSGWVQEHGWAEGRRWVEGEGAELTSAYFSSSSWWVVLRVVSSVSNSSHLACSLYSDSSNTFIVLKSERSEGSIR